MGTFRNYLDTRILPAVMLNMLLTVGIAIGLSACKKSGTEPTPPEVVPKDEIAEAVKLLPDFSYAGYGFGEKPIPDPGYKTFNVTDFGAVPDDEISDKAAIQLAIAAAQANGSGIVFFPKGVYLIKETEDKFKPILVTGNNIILRGSVGTILFARTEGASNDLNSLIIKPDAWDGPAATISENAPAGSFNLTLDKIVTGLNVNDWIALSLSNNTIDRIKAELAPHVRESEWTEIQTTGDSIKTFHKVKSINGNKITLYNPLAYPITAADNWIFCRWNRQPQTGVGVENIHFKGNFTKPFVHHGTATDDYGWIILNIYRNADSWIKDCTFENVVGCGNIVLCTNISILNCQIIGNAGHNAISSQASTNVLIAKCKDTSSQWHTWGVAKQTMNTVIWRCESPSTNSCEMHATQPRNTLIDCMKGGFYNNRGGGDIANMPNHLQNLILWNYNMLNSAVKGFDFWPKDPWYWRVHSVTIIGGFTNGTSFLPSSTVTSVSVGKMVQPESLYELQLINRLGNIPQWLSDIKK